MKDSIPHENSFSVSVPDHRVRHLAVSLGTWAQRTLGTVENIKGLAFGNGTFVAVGTKGYISTSPDGVTWKSTTKAPEFASDFIERP